MGSTSEEPLSEEEAEKAEQKETGEKLKQSEVLKPGQFVEMAELPKCDFGCGKDAKFDSQSIVGSWGYMCSTHYREYGVGKLGTGYGQKLLLQKGK